MGKLRSWRLPLFLGGLPNMAAVLSWRLYSRLLAQDSRHQSGGDCRRDWAPGAWKSPTVSVPAWEVVQSCFAAVSDSPQKPAQLRRWEIAEVGLLCLGWNILGSLAKVVCPPLSGWVLLKASLLGSMHQHSPISPALSLVLLLMMGFL